MDVDEKGFAEPQSKETVRPSLKWTAITCQGGPGRFNCFVLEYSVVVNETVSIASRDALKIMRDTERVFADRPVVLISILVNDHGSRKHSFYVMHVSSFSIVLGTSSSIHMWKLFETKLWLELRTNFGKRMGIMPAQRRLIAENKLIWKKATRCAVGYFTKQTVPCMKRTHILPKCDTVWKASTYWIYYLPSRI